MPHPPSLPGSAAARCGGPRAAQRWCQPPGRRGRRSCRAVGAGTCRRRSACMGAGRPGEARCNHASSTDCAQLCARLPCPPALPARLLLGPPLTWSTARHVLQTAGLCGGVQPPTLSAPRCTRRPRAAWPRPPGTPAAPAAAPAAEGKGDLITGGVSRGRSSPSNRSGRPASTLASAPGWCPLRRARSCRPGAPRAQPARCARPPAPGAWR